VGQWAETRIVKSSAADEVAKLKRQSGKDTLDRGAV
jgi:hypothetical protein